MDCQAAKEFLSQHNIDYVEHDLSIHPEREDLLKEVSGTRIVPTFVFQQPGLFGLFKKKKILIGFEVNEKEIKKLLLG
ncbi:glutaredoxin family protein [Tepidibacillus decaturensis]|uniref:glutaredoxin family protein n=1 Tax=Tepidibacillus decaturensis TaxID=1413211 RepID=UPI0022863F78|nr:glutaredoxin family protein [Tepidibacillus decaturensis]